MAQVLEVKNISVGYENGQEILQDISFKANSGEFIGIIGPNGAGKSTLLKSIRGFLPLKQGSVALFNTDIKDISVSKMARQVAYLQQQVEATFDYTVRDLVEAGRYPYKKWWQTGNSYDQKVVEACMKYTGVMELAERSIRSLSGGQRQRALLAKVLAQQTSILYLDEPATGLDIFYQEEIFKFCAELAQNKKTVIMVIHELSLAARYCSRLLLIKDGRLLADDMPQRVISSELLTRAYGVPIQVSYNPITRHADVFVAEEEKRQNQRELLNVILGNLGRGADLADDLSS